MSTAAEQATDKAAKRCRVDPDSASSGSQNPDAITPASNPELGANREDGSSSGRDGETVQKMLQNFTGGITQSFIAKRKQSVRDINASFKSLGENLQNIFLNEQKLRQDLHLKYAQTFEPLYQQWSREMQRAREQEHHLALLSQHQMNILRTATRGHVMKFDQVKDLCDTYLKNVKDMTGEHGTFLSGRQSEVEKEISKVQERVIMETQEQDVAVLEMYLQSMVGPEGSEESVCPSCV